MLSRQKIAFYSHLKQFSQLPQYIIQEIWDKAPNYFQMQQLTNRLTTALTSPEISSSMPGEGRQHTPLSTQSTYLT